VQPKSLDWRKVVLEIESRFERKLFIFCNGWLVTSCVSINTGPRLFLSCPMEIAGSKVWFTDLWNYSIVPYLLEAVREGLQVCTHRKRPLLLSHDLKFKYSYLHISFSPTMNLSQPINVMNCSWVSMNAIAQVHYSFTGICKLIN
jgi:hypothetical protein